MSVNPNMLFCERHRGSFFSRKFAESGVMPKQCPVCKRYDWRLKK